VLREDPFGLEEHLRRLRQFPQGAGDPAYLNSVQVTVVFSVLTAFGAGDRAVSGRAGRQDRARQGVLPDADDLALCRRPAIAGMLWLFMFNPSFGTLAWPLRQMGIDWNPLLNGGRRWRWWSPRRPGSRSATTSCSSSPGCRPSPSR
jgi:sn-glycerol 3-phosphate transport system permease protein